MLASPLAAAAPPAVRLRRLRPLPEGFAELLSRTPGDGRRGDLDEVLPTLGDVSMARGEAAVDVLPRGEAGAGVLPRGEAGAGATLRGEGELGREERGGRFIDGTEARAGRRAGPLIFRLTLSLGIQPLRTRAFFRVITRW
jgi:hypothetical protein